MASWHNIAIILCLVLGCVLLAFVAEFYYLLCWKKKRVTTQSEIEEVDYKKLKKLFLFLNWIKKPSSFQHIDTTTTTNSSLTSRTSEEQDIETGSTTEKHSVEESVESELMRLHNLQGPPRFLFTINEETKEDLESEDRSKRGSRNRSLSELLMVNIDTPFLTPIASPMIKPISPSQNGLEFYSHHGLNPLFEASPELNRLRSSPPPKFKFLRDAEEKFIKRLLKEAGKKSLQIYGHVQDDAHHSNTLQVFQ